jgi:phenylacetate-CoA ligase
MIQPQETFESLKLLINPRKSPEQIKRIQNQKLHKLVKHSYEKVPYYRRLFDSLKLKPEDIQCTDDLKKLPLLSKKIIKSLPLEQFIAKGIDIKNCRTAMTSGSTGIPLQVYYDWRDARMIGAALVRNFLTFGIKPWYRIADFFNFAEPPRKRRIFDRLGIWRSLKLSGWEGPDDWIKKLQNWKPQAIYGSSMTLKHLAITIMEKGLKQINPQITISTAAVLDDASRSIISSAFKAKVFDFYASWEGGEIAWECPQCAGYHVNSDMVVLEVLKNGKSVPPGQEGEVVITNLHSYAMPFIRYRQEDVAVLSEDKPICSSPFPMIKQLKGRLTDFIILPSGKRLTPLLFFNVLGNTPAIAQYRIIQEKIDHLIIEIVPVTGFNQSHSAEIETELKKVVGEGMKIEILQRKEIDFTSIGKKRIIYSKVCNDEDSTTKY